MKKNFASLYKSKFFPLYILIAVAMCVWYFCYPLSTYIAEKNFKSYIEEYSIPYEEIESYEIIKPYLFRNINISVEYKSDPDYKYVYVYSLGNFFLNEPQYIRIFGGKHKNISINENQYYNVEYPPVTIKKDYRVK